MVIVGGAVAFAGAITISVDLGANNSQDVPADAVVVALGFVLMVVGIVFLRRMRSQASNASPQPLPTPDPRSLGAALLGSTVVQTAVAKQPLPPPGAVLRRLVGA